jgi:hypothetical protein
VTLPPVRIAVADAGELERRAAALAAGDAAEEARAGGAAITFRLDGVPCAIEAAAVERVVLRLATVVAIPLAGGGVRAAAFVDERPLPVVDLLRPARDAQALGDAPALVVGGPSGAVALAVQGPLDLTEAPVAAAAEPAPPGDDRPRIAGRLADGTALLDTGWIRRLTSVALAP